MNEQSLASGQASGGCLLWRRGVPFYGCAMARLLLAALLLLLGPALMPAALAAESEAVRSPRATATLVAAASAVAPGEPVELGLRLRLAPGWHSYWRNPGDAGAPPTLEVTGGKAGPIAYPTPTRSVEGPFVTYGYTGDVLLPVTVTVGPGPASLSAHATSPQSVQASSSSRQDIT